ncbi:hypothetical protein Tco_0546860 [Tanacetum coccineum]
MVWLDGGVDGGCEVDEYVWGDKDGEYVILEGDDSGVVSMVGNSGMSTPEYPLEAFFILLNSFCVSVGVGKVRLVARQMIAVAILLLNCSQAVFLGLKQWRMSFKTFKILKLEMSSNGGLRNKYLDLPIYGTSDSPDSILSCAQSSSLPKLFYRRSIKGWAFSEGILDVTCS